MKNVFDFFKDETVVYCGASCNIPKIVFERAKGGCDAVGIMLAKGGEMYKSIIAYEYDQGRIVIYPPIKTCEQAGEEFLVVKNDLDDKELEDMLVGILFKEVDMKYFRCTVTPKLSEIEKYLEEKGGEMWCDGRRHRL
ncbi:hypothetical protein IKF15_03840 [Candidatus Saccharibacteria bacterium]|nr:hypothetical protein [Candidatus Saccharibacteria bacterium]